MVGAIDASTYEGIATTLFGHSQPVRTLVWSLQSKGPGHKIGWDEFIAFAEQDDHIPSTAEEWEKIVEVLGARDAMLGAEAVFQTQYAVLVGAVQLCSTSSSQPI